VLYEELAGMREIPSQLEREGEGDE